MTISLKWITIATYKKKGRERMIAIKLSRIMGDQRKSIQNVADETGLSRSTLSCLYNDKVTRVDLQTLDKLCECLNCEPGDILERVKDIE